MGTAVSKDIFVSILLQWYTENKRVFPWRYVSDPFLVLVSEFFLQQTKSEDVAKYFEVLTRKYGNVSKLAQADTSFMKTIFGKLGLFYRAERLVSAAKYVLVQFNGEIPESLEELLTIPGVGQYSGNAILCFGFGKRVGIVDANIIRIYSRVFNVRSKNVRPRTDGNLWKFAHAILPEDHFVDFNYALLDFGKLVCSSRKPKCAICPLSRVCLYYNCTV